MDTPSKERLVGAIIFVVLIVLLVPEILSGPRRASPAGGASASGSTRTYTIDLGNPVKPAATQPIDAKPTSLPPPPAVAPEQPPAASPPQTQPPPSTAVSVKPSAAAEVKPSAAAPAKPSVAAEAKPSGAAEVKAPVAAPAAAGKESWGAQLGSFAKAENAERLAASLRAKGYRAFVSPTGTGSHVLHRVRVGPEPTRAAAETLVARLKRDGQAASVITLP